MRKINHIKMYFGSYRVTIAMLVMTLILFNPLAVSPILLPIMMGVEIIIKSIITHMIRVFQQQGSAAVKQVLVSIWK